MFGVTETVFALVVAQGLTTLAVGCAAAVVLRRFPAAAPVPLGEDRRLFRRFVLQSSAGSVLSPMRGLLGTMLLGGVAGPQQVAFLRVAQTPESAFASLTAPARLILLTEQTDDVERGRVDRAYRTLRNYVAGAGILLLVTVPALGLAMPWLLEVVFGDQAAPAADAARIFLVVAAIHVVCGWAKSFPVSIGRPELRLLAQGAEIAVLVPALLVLGSRYGATGAAVAFLLAAVAFAGVWSVLLVRLVRGRRSAAVPEAQTAAAAAAPRSRVSPT
jgi:O-antigen/teichoic acid export membrane protein